MKQGKVAGWAVAAVAITGVAACGGNSGGGGGSADTTAPAPQTVSSATPGQSGGSGQPGGGSGPSGGLTAPGTHLGFGQQATVAWVPPQTGLGPGAHAGLKLRVTAESIQRGTLADFPPKPFVSGKTYQSCLTYLMPGGGAIQKVQWNDGPAKANQVTPYFDNPIVWG